MNFIRNPTKFPRQCDNVVSFNSVILYISKFYSQFWINSSCDVSKSYQIGLAHAAKITNISCTINPNCTPHCIITYTSKGFFFNGGSQLHTCYLNTKQKSYAKGFIVVLILAYDRMSTKPELAIPERIAYSKFNCCFAFVILSNNYQMLFHAR